MKIVNILGEEKISCSALQRIGTSAVIRSGLMAYASVKSLMEPTCSVAFELRN